MSVYLEKAISIGTTLTVLDCCICGVVFGLPSDVADQRRKDGARFWCPNGHAQQFTESTETKLRAAEERIRHLERTEGALNEGYTRLYDISEGRRKEIQRMKRRAKAGMCQKCRRSFQNIQRHYATKHPEGGGCE